jgi:hypothetical protein
MWNTLEDSSLSFYNMRLYFGVLTDDEVGALYNRDGSTMSYTGPLSTKVKIGNTANFNISNQGGTYGYQWYNINSLGETGLISGATSSSYSIVVSLANEGFKYFCKLTDSFGELYTAEATLTVFDSDIYAQPSSIQEYEGDTGSFSIGATGYNTNLLYQWYRVSGGVTGAISGATGANYYVVLDSTYDNNKIGVSFVSNIIANTFNGNIINNELTFFRFRNISVCFLFLFV